ncbi:MAG TPA: phosphoribosylanthranilate isomerase [Xanthobacteraceae bacterium]|nr:phosphoribosylanthranilate isomerase [Xanthobacteraceae bacterium]
MLEVKICGIKDLGAMNAALSAGADLVGLVFFPPSPRAVTPLGGADLAAAARGRAMVTALVVDADDVLLRDIMARVNPDLLQLHGSETPERVKAIRACFGKPVAKAISVSSAADLNGVAAYETVADRILYDAKPPKDADRPGGHGLVFDWNLLSAASRKKPMMLSGGLTPENVADAIRIVRPDGVDVSSGVEDTPGVKSVTKIKLFVENARAAAKKNSPEKVS